VSKLRQIVKHSLCDQVLAPACWLVAQISILSILCTFSDHYPIS